jgi:hypothetical protein
MKNHYDTKTDWASGMCWMTVLGVLCASGWQNTAWGQALHISSPVVTSNSVALSFPGRVDSYYLLHAASSLSVTSPPVAALLGIAGTQVFRSPLSGRALFFRVEQIPTSSTNSVLGDRIPDSWKLLHALSVFDPGVVNQIAPGDTS